MLGRLRATFAVSILAAVAAIGLGACDTPGEDDPVVERRPGEMSTSEVAVPEGTGGKVTLEAPLTGERGSGRAALTINAARDEVCFRISVDGIKEVTGTHVHEGDEGEDGPIVVPLEAPIDGSSEGCVDADADVVRRIVADPGGHYVNVHTKAAPAGALRGQLKRAG